MEESKLSLVGGNNGGSEPLLSRVAVMDKPTNKLRIQKLQNNRVRVARKFFESPSKTHYDWPLTSYRTPTNPDNWPSERDTKPYY
uniref:Uncharacterized protein n=1 Tax=Oryza punctata TaxID=4537 RepID=A0A0E0JWP7_ORYPU